METWQDPKSFAIGLGIVILVFLLLTAFILLFSRLTTKRLLKEQKEKSRMKLEHQKGLTNAVIDMQEKERARIAADLHDDLVGKLRAVHLLMSGVKSSENIDPKELLSQSIELTREISHDLMPPMLKESELSELIEEASFLLHDKHQLSISELGYDEPNVSEDIKLQLFRVLKEVVNNLDKHAEASHVDISYRITPLSVCVIISDDGKGFPKEIQQNGLGMKNIELRAQRLSAKYKFKNRVENGTSFIIFMPLKAKTYEKN